MNGRTDDTPTFDEYVPLPRDPERPDESVLVEHKAELWALVLEAVGIPFHFERVGRELHLLVPQRFYHEALRQLRLFEEENRNWPPAAQDPPAGNDNILVTVCVLLLVAAFHNITLLDIPLPGDGGIDWVAAGSADAGKIMSGQWWRTITALTLHADSLHLAGNLLIGGIFISFVCRDFGSGLGWGLLLFSGSLGNLANAFVQPADHISIGASTTVFGAVGILAAAALVRYRHHRQKLTAIPLAAGIALLALLGTEGKNTDLGAHLFGFVFGLALGLIASLPLVKYGPPKAWVNRSLAVASGALVVAAWRLAL